MVSPAALDPRKLQAEILHALLQGRAPDLTALHQAGTRDELLRAWDELVQRGAVVVDRSGNIIAAYPLSAIRTKHRVEVGSFTTWANCAIDALAVPPMVGSPGRIVSECAHCGRKIIIEVEGEVVHGTPVETVVGYGGLADCCDRPAIEARVLTLTSSAVSHTQIHGRGQIRGSGSSSRWPRLPSLPPIDSVPSLTPTGLPSQTTTRRLVID